MQGGRRNRCVTHSVSHLVTTIRTEGWMDGGGDVFHKIITENIYAIPSEPPRGAHKGTAHKSPWGHHKGPGEPLGSCGPGPCARSKNLVAHKALAHKGPDHKGSKGPTRALPTRAHGESTRAQGAHTGPAFKGPGRPTGARPTRAQGFHKGPAHKGPAKA